ncbi:hydroxypyruvate isomerase family protein [Parasulfitobacter algicola]|uniref:TIM barrel protein n=1 Tax=Parasulfitobacter algicola TaxID=2614809 RepID=A0ABX2IL23_9RHOB|nr:TIM barrel protein [Sulfitobacter algicola]NSX53265.1 TIM barrel protein [Sulfitobacter algicola]
MNFSANLGFLFTDLSLPDGIRAAKAAGFSAVECHFPYDTRPADIMTALTETGLPMLGLNTHPGNRDAGEFGLSAMPGRGADARAEIDRACDYAVATGTRMVHVMAGRTDGGPDADQAFVDTLSYATERAATNGLDILIEPINHRDVPGYHLSRVEQAVDLIDRIGAPNLKIMFDCYHVQIMQGDLIQRFRTHQHMIGHVQIAAVPDRGEPDQGELSYHHIIPALRDLGYTAPIGAEYKPRGTDTDAGLGWLSAYSG